MKYGIDTRWMDGWVRGMGKFALQLVQPLVDSGQLVGFHPGKLAGVHPYPVFSSDWSQYPIWEQWALPSLAKNEGVDFLICPYNTGPLWISPKIPTIAVIHDLIFLDSPYASWMTGSAYQQFGRLYRALVVPRIAKNARFIVTVSEYSKRQIVQRLSIPAEKISVIPNALGESWYQYSQCDNNCAQPAFLTVSGDAPSKNLEALIIAFSIAAAELMVEYKLWVVGVPESKHKKFYNLAQRHGVGGRLVLYGILPEVELQRLYRSAQAFVFPSIEEGFGIPLIEAMASGAPIATSNSSVMPSIVANAAIFFNPFDVVSIAQALLRLAREAPLRSELSSIGLVRSLQFSQTQVKSLVQDFWRNTQIK